MSILISKKSCIGCKKCIDVCPGNLIKIGEDKKAYIKYPRDCWGCCSCIKECNNSAIKLYLGADIGGRGSLMYVNKEGEFINWKIEESNGQLHDIYINPKDSNRY